MRMKDIRVYCKNTQEYWQIAPGTELAELKKKFGIDACAAYVDNQLKELGYPLYMPHSIEFLDYTHPDGRRCYKRSIYIFINFSKIAI